jgi:ADP-ribose pyrophosphatase YjhB (NUDIX family)
MSFSRCLSGLHERSMTAIRAKAVCVCTRDDSILVGRAVDAVKQQTFYGPLGGGVEFGERADEAMRREMLEELNRELVDLELLGVVENIFTYEGTPGHEIVFVFDARFADATAYEIETLVGEESNGQRFEATWMPLRDFAPGGPPLYPTGTYELVAETFARRRAE